MPSAASAAQIFLALSVVLITARVASVAVGRLGQAPVVGEIAAGIVLGPTVLGAIPGLSAMLLPEVARDGISVVGQIGVMTLMFLVGLRLDLAAVSRSRRALTVISAGSLVVPFALGAGLALVIASSHELPRPAADRPVAFVVFMATALSITAFPVLARIIREHALQGTHVANLALGCAAANDIVGWCMLAAALILLNGGGLADAGSSAVEVMCLGATLAVAAGPPMLRRMVRKAPRVIRGGTEPTMFLLLALSAGMLTHALGLHAAIGSFSVGVLFPRAQASDLRDSVTRIAAPLATITTPVYFAAAGLQIDLTTMRAEDVAEFLLILTVACTAKLAGTAIAARTQGLDGRDAATLAVLMNTRGLMELVVLNIGLAEGILDARLYTVMVAMAVTTTVMTSPLLKRLAKGRSTPRISCT